MTDRPGKGYAVAVATLIALALVLRLPALEVGFIVDDYAQLAMMKGVYPVSRGPLELFSFTSGALEENEALQRAGFFPFWTHPELRIAMFRPLASALMWLDFYCFGLDAYAYHLHSLAWWLGLLALAAMFFGKVLPRPWSLLALALFAAEEAHTMLLGWIAMRNAIVASALAVLALLLIQRSHAAGRRAVARSALACFALGLAASEYAVAYAGYVLLLEASQPTERARRLGAWVGLLAGYFALRGVLGFGSFGSGMYVDPLAEPLQFARQATARLPVLAGDLFGVIRADFWTSGFPRGPELAARGVLPVAWTTDMRPLQALQQQLGVVVLILGLAASAWAARRAPSPGARALALGAPLALVPVLSSLPESRLLAPAMFGWSAALAVLAHEAWTRIRERRSPLRVLALALCTLLVLHHLLLPSWISVTDARNGKHAAQAVRDSITAPELDARLGPAEHTLLLGAADPTTTIYVPLLRRVEGRPGPKNCHLLAAGFSQHRLQRRAPNTFVLERLQQGHTPGDNYARAFNSNALQVGARVQLHGMRVTLERVRNGRPQRTRYDFDRSLDDPSVVLLQQTVLGLRVVPFPPIGQSVVLPPPVPPFALIRRP